MLDRIFVPAQLSNGKCHLQIIVISAVGLSTPLDWINSSETEPWIKILAKEVVPQAEVWQFVYPSPRQESISETILREGSELFENLQNHYEVLERRAIPLVFIAHGTGGLILKKALNLFQAQFFRFRHVIDVIRGAVFLGSPHLSQQGNQATETLDLLLKCQRKGLGRSLSSPNDVMNIVDICVTFEHVNLGVRVISVYEGKGIQTQRKIFGRRKKKDHEPIVVPRRLCTWTDASWRSATHAETVLDSEASHTDICNVYSKGRVFTEIAALLQEVVETGPDLIAEVSGRRTLPQALENVSLASRSESGEPTSNPKNSSGLATGGTSFGSLEIVPQQESAVTTIKNPKLPCFSLGSHRKLESFYGRLDVLEKIDRFLLPSEANQDSDEVSELRSFTICGMGGMGKSEIAVEYAYLRRDRFEAVFWLSADDPSILAAEFANIAHELGLQADDDAQDLVASRDIVIGWLANPMRTAEEPESPQNEVNWLLVFDNVDNQDVLADYWPKTGRGSVLVTSRDPFAKHGLHTKHGIDLAPLSKIESENLMQKLTSVKADASQREALTVIVEKLGGFPLAIQTMAGVFRQLRHSYTSFLRYYNDVGIESLHQQAGGTQKEKFRSLVTLWALDTLKPKSRALLEMLSILDPDEIPEELLIPDSTHLDMEDYPANTGEYYTARSELLSSSLISQNSEQENISLHRLIQETARGSMNKDRLFKIYDTATRLIIATWPFQSMKQHHYKARFRRCESLYPCVLRLKDGLEPLIMEKGFPLDIQVAQLLNDTGWYLFERGLIAELRPFCKLALAIGERMQEDSNDETNRTVRESHSYLGIAAAETNEHSYSLLHKQKWLDMLLSRTDDNGQQMEDYELGYAYNEIGVAYGNTNLLDKAAEAFTRSIEIFQASTSFEDTDLGWPQPNLGFIYWMQGKLSEAEEVLVEILDIHTAEWGTDDTTSFKTGKILYALGNVLEAQGRFQESQNFHERCQEQYKVTLGLAHHRMGDVCCKLAQHCIRQGLYNDAEEYLSRAMKIFENRSYLAHEKTRATFLRGSLLRLKGEEAAAKKVLMQAWISRKRLRPNDTRKPDQLELQDYDELVAFWSR